MKRRRIPDLTSETFGRLLVLYRTDDTKKVCYVTECVCGTISTKRAAALIRGTSRSCGCLRREIAREKIADGTCEREVRHLFATRRNRNPVYKLWMNFRRRYANDVSADFTEFYRQVGPKPYNTRARLRRQPNGSFEWKALKEKQ